MSPPGPDLKAIFCEALERPAGPERSAYLDDACQEDATLRRQVESLLEAHHEAGGFLGSAIDGPRIAPARAPESDDSTVSLRHPAIAEGPGAVIGPYKLLQRIGEGGMGSVFMAEQTHPVRRKVALKVIKPGMDTAMVIARFEAERQALAIMDHPNIARVLDVGATDTGRPFFVMELVKGVPITEYCDRGQLTPKERLELFIPVCQAIQHAHQKGIIHRDIKPSNVMVTLHDGKPVPKVIDFGVAKAIEQRLTEKTLFTEFGAVIGTLEYMSPEQAEMGALDIDTRSDIYSLGVLLYELLTGSTPLERAKLRKAAFSEILRRIREEEPTKPSTRLSDSRDALPSISAQRKMDPTRLTKLVRGELDWIVMKSLEKDRTRRYETATGFARDIRRHLDGDAVEACPPSASYKLKKFARKHRAALATAGAFALLLVAATATGVALALWANRERTRAEDREQLAIRAVRRFRDVVADEPELKNNPAFDGLRKRLLKEPLAFFLALRDRLQADRDTRPESLARLAEANFDLGKLSDEIGDKQDALVAYRESLVIRRKLVDANPSVTGFQRDLAVSYDRIGILLHVTGKLTEALKSHVSALAIQQRLADSDPADIELQNDLAGSHNNIGLLLSVIGKPAEALTAYKSALEIQQKLSDAHPSVTALQSDLAKIQHNIVDPLRSTGNPDEALKAARSALVIQQKLADAHPSVTDFQNDLASSHNNIGILLKSAGKPAEALMAYESALEIQRKLADAHPTVTVFQSNLADSYHSIGVLLHESGKPAEALKSDGLALAIRRKLADANPTVTRFQSDLARSHNIIGIVLFDIKKPTEAQKAYESALEIQRKLTREHPESRDFASELGMTLNNLARIDRDAKRFGEARDRVRQAAEWHRKALAFDPANPTYQRFLALCLGNQINVARRMGDSESVAEAERELANLRDSDPARKAVDARLAAVLQGQVPKDDAERIQLALRAYEKTLYAVSARLFAEALANDPKLGDDRQAQHRYNAACAASLAASGKGKDDPPVDDVARTKFRRQALDWLKAELSAWTEVVTRAGPGNKETVAKTLQHWKTDTDLAAIRDKTALAKLSDKERAAFERLWTDVDQLLTKASSGQ